MGISGTAQKWAKEYGSVNEIACGLSLVEKDGKHGYVNKDGKVVIAITYDEGMNFAEGKAGIRIDNKWGLLIVPEMYS
jgi:hypothetical protein